MPVIQLTPEFLDDKAASLRSTAQTNEDVIGRLNTLIDGLEADWEGDAYNAFRESYLAKRETFQKFTLDMNKFADYMTEFADIMREEEKRMAAAARGL